MERIKIIKILTLSLTILSLVLGVRVIGGKKQGQIIIEPHAFDPPDPVTVTSPATFYITVKEHTAKNPQILFVMSEECYDEGINPIITISREWDPYCPDGALKKDAFTWIEDGGVPGGIWGDIYQAKSLRDHLGVPEEKGVGIWYAYVDMCVDEIKEENPPYEITVTVNSPSPRVLVYVFGEESKVPPTRPGFIIPEFTFGTVMSILALLSGLGVYSKFRKR